MTIPSPPAIPTRPAPPLTTDSALGELPLLPALGPGPLSHPDLSTLLFLARGSGSPPHLGHQQLRGSVSGGSWLSLRDAAGLSEEGCPLPGHQWPHGNAGRVCALHPLHLLSRGSSLRETCGVHLSFQQPSLPFGGTLGQQEGWSLEAEIGVKTSGSGYSHPGTQIPRLREDTL